MAHGDDRDETNQRCVLKREAIDAMPGRDKVHFLDATARRHNLSLGDATGLTGLGIHLVTLPPGSRSTGAKERSSDGSPLTAAIAASAPVRLASEISE